MRTKLISIGFILISMTLVSFGQTRQEKTIAIIKKLNLIESQKQNYEFQLGSLKYQAVGNDSIRIRELENQLTDNEIVKKISSAFNEVFSDEEMNDIYNFIQTSAFNKFFKSGETYKIMASKFKDIDKEIEEITNNSNIIIEKPAKKFEPIPVDRENGFYAIVDYNFSAPDKDIKLEDRPSLTTKDILKAKKVFNSNNNQLEINIVFTKEGAKKFYVLTKENIGQPLAIVIAKQIIAMPSVYSEIRVGKASISGDFSEKEIDRMIEILQEKK